MRILAIDTSTSCLTLALAQDGELITEHNLFHTQMHTEELLTYVHRSLESHGITVRDLNLLAVGMGPGSFTGLRVGCATLKGLQLALGIPWVGISSLELIAYNLAHVTGAIAVCIDARRDRVYSALYTACAGALERVTEEEVLRASDFLQRLREYRTPLVLTGDACRTYQREFTALTASHVRLADELTWFPRASQLARLACTRYNDRQSVNVRELLPRYLQLSHPEERHLNHPSSKGHHAAHS